MTTEAQAHAAARAEEALEAAHVLGGPAPEDDDAIYELIADLLDFSKLVRAIDTDDVIEFATNTYEARSDDA